MDLRMPSLNTVILAARLTRDPECRVIPSGMALAKLGLAQSRKYRTKDGDQKEETLFINATCWGKTADYVRDNFKKGRPVLVEGRLKLDEWSDAQSGEKRSTIEISVERLQALDWEERNGSHAASSSAAKSAPREVEEDSIPF